MEVDDETLTTLRSIVGDDTSDSTLRALLLRSGGDVAAAANSFFDGAAASLSATFETATSASSAAVPAVGDDVLCTLFKTLEDQGRKLAERDQQLDMASRVCEALVRRLRETERTLATADADRSEREAAEAEVQTEDSRLFDPGSGDSAAAGGAVGRLGSPLAFLCARLPLLGYASSLLPLHTLKWLGGMLASPLLLTYRLSGVLGREADGAGGGVGDVAAADAMDVERDADAERGAGAGETAVSDADGDDAQHDDDDDDEGEDDDDDDDDEGDEGDDDDDEEEEDEDEDEDDDDDDEEEVRSEEEEEGEGHPAAAAAVSDSDRAAQLAAAVAAAQSAILEALELPGELVDQVRAHLQPSSEPDPTPHGSGASPRHPNGHAPN